MCNSRMTKKPVVKILLHVGFDRVFRDRTTLIYNASCTGRLVKHKPFEELRIISIITNEWAILESYTLRYSNNREYLRAVDVLIRMNPRRSSRGKVNINMVYPRAVSGLWHYSQTIYKAKLTKSNGLESLSRARENGDSIGPCEIWVGLVLHQTL